MKCVMLFFILMIFSIYLSAQPPDPPSQSSYSEIFQKSFFKGQYPQIVPVLFHSYPVYEANNRYKIVMIVQIQYGYLQFLYEEGNYNAGVEFDVGFRDRESKEIISKIWQTSLQVKDFESTHARRLYHFAADSLFLPVGEYDISFKYKDINGLQRLAYMQQISLPKVEREYIANPLFFYPDQPYKNPFFPSSGEPSPLMQNWDFNRDLGVYYEIWRADSSKTMPIKIELMNTENGKTLFSLDTVLANTQKHQSLEITIPANFFREGAHRLKTVYHAGSDSSSKEGSFNVIWFDKPISMWDYDLAVQPLSYIIQEEEYRELLQGNKKERVDKLNRFWEERDPTPETPFNELQNEFYSRVDSALMRFSTKKRLGWKTDLGKIYISQGPPDEVDDQSLSPSRPYLKWIYFEEGKRYVYTFRAIDGRKEYELVDTEESSL